MLEVLERARIQVHRSQGASLWAWSRNTDGNRPQTFTQSKTTDAQFSCKTQTLNRAIPSMPHSYVESPRLCIDLSIFSERSIRSLDDRAITKGHMHLVFSSQASHAVGFYGGITSNLRSGILAG